MPWEAGKALQAWLPRASEPPLTWLQHLQMHRSFKTWGRHNQKAVPALPAASSQCCHTSLPVLAKQQLHEKQSCYCTADLLPKKFKLSHRVHVALMQHVPMYLESSLTFTQMHSTVQGGSLGGEDKAWKETHRSHFYATCTKFCFFSPFLCELRIFEPLVVVQPIELECIKSTATYEFIRRSFLGLSILS